MKHYRHFLLFITASAVLASCDYIDPKEIHEGSKILITGSKWDIDTSFLNSTVAQPSMVLLEEYTGHYCGNCPDAARQAKKLDSIYTDRLHVMAIHAGFFAQPKNNADGSFSADFRCQAGIDLDNKFKVSESVPKGLINRGRFGGSSTALLSSSSWEGRINEIFNGPTPDFNFYLHPFYDDSLNQFYALTHIKMWKQVSIPIKVALYLTEDSIKNWQLDYKATPDKNPNYYHRHMLRDAFTPVEGSDSPGPVPFVPGKTTAGRWVCTKRNEINRKYCTVIAIVYRSDTDEILQAVEAEIEDR